MGTETRYLNLGIIYLNQIFYSGKEIIPTQKLFLKYSASCSKINEEKHASRKTFTLWLEDIQFI